MAYKEVSIMEIKEIIRRLQAGQSKNQISKSIGRDRKTISKYPSQSEQEGLLVSHIDINDGRMSTAHPNPRRDQKYSPPIDAFVGAE